jgi:hypothetical protein
MDFRVLSYNIHRAIGVDRLFRPERIANIIRYYQPDIVLLQEVDDGVPRSRGLNLATELATALGFEHYKLGANVSLRKGAYGNATLSRFPIVRERNIDLTIGSRKRRGCQPGAGGGAAVHRRRRLQRLALAAAADLHRGVLLRLRRRGRPQIEPADEDLSFVLAAGLARPLLLPRPRAGARATLPARAVPGRQ